MATNAITEEEKKALITMLSKLYITPNSDPTKLEAAKDLAAEAVDSKIATDAPSRNALNKLYTALSKALGENGTAGKSAEGVTIVETRQNEGLTAVEEEGAVAHGGEEVEETEVQAATEVGESLLEELLDDEEEELWEVDFLMGGNEWSMMIGWRGVSALHTSTSSAAWSIISAFWKWRKACLSSLFPNTSQYRHATVPRPRQVTATRHADVGRRRPMY